jgi:hypothetical protein
MTKADVHAAECFDLLTRGCHARHATPAPAHTNPLNFDLVRTALPAASRSEMGLVLGNPKKQGTAV